MPLSPETPVLTISQLNREARAMLETGFPATWVEGEISNIARPGSGHLYFTLKDSHAQIRCAMFRRANRRLEFVPEDGQQVLVHARVTIYEPRGSFQLIIEAMEPAGEGLLRKRFEALKKKLAAEGLFDAALKQPLPRWPRCIGVITSPTGAALRDILQILRRRFAAVPVIVYPVRVQGERAGHDIVAALETATRRGECDVLVVGRGGGSLEDLWTFNEEIVARAIHACAIPVVSAVGHEIDFTIADLVADLRAPTPSAAAELIVPDSDALRGELAALDARAARALHRLAEARRLALTHLDNRLARCHPGVILRQLAQRLDETRQRLNNGIRRESERQALRLRHARSRLRSAAPLGRLQHAIQRLDGLQLGLSGAIRGITAAHRERLAVAAARLDGVSPLKTLERGYAIVQDERGGIVRDAGRLETGQKVSARLARGGFDAIVKKVSAD